MRARLGAALVCLLVMACTADEFALRAGIPGTGVRGEIAGTRTRDGYLDATVITGSQRLRFFFPITEDCLAVLVDDAEVMYMHGGSAGSVRSGELRCDAIGILSLPEWRSRGPRLRGPPNPRVQANYRVFYSDEELVLARGRFGLAHHIGWTGGSDTVGIIPNVPECSTVISNQVASLEFRTAGPIPFLLIDQSRRCPLLGFAHVQATTPR